MNKGYKSSRNITGLKRCQRCLLKKPFAEFPRYEPTIHNPYGQLSHRCTDCKLRFEKIRRERNLDTIEKYMNSLGGRTLADICYDEDNKLFIPMYKADGGIYRDYVPEEYL